MEVTDTSELCEAVRERRNFEGERDRERLKDRPTLWTSI